MKSVFFSLFILCFYFGESTIFLNDSLIKKKKRYIEVKSSSILFFQGKSGEAGNNDKVFGVPSENFNIAIGKNFTSFFSCGINFDYSKFNLTGQAKLAGWNSDTKVITKYRFLIRQNVQISHLSFGFTPNYNYRYRKFIMDLGIGVYFTLYRSIKVINHYEDEQTNYPFSKGPVAGVKIIDDENNVRRHWLISYFGPTFNIGYQLNENFGVRFSSAFYYTYLENILGNTYGYNTLPEHSIYTIRRESWITSGISLVFNY